MSQIFRKIDNRFLDRGGLCSCSHGASSVSPLLLWGLLLYFTENLTSNFNQCGGSFPFIFLVDQAVISLERLHAALMRRQILSSHL